MLCNLKSIRGHTYEFGRLSSAGVISIKNKRPEHLNFEDKMVPRGCLGRFFFLGFWRSGAPWEGSWRPCWLSGGHLVFFGLIFGGLGGPWATLCEALGVILDALGVP